MKELLDDDDPLPKKPPEYCPWCGDEVKKRWVPNKLLWLGQRLGVRVTYVCLKCKIAVRAFRIPPRPLCETKKAARAEAQRDYDELEASGFRSKHARELYARGKCACGPVYTYMPKEPCAVHRPLQRHP